MVIRSVGKALATPTFIGQSVINIGMSLLFNFGLPVLLYSKFGSRTERVQYPKIYVWQWSIDAGSNIALDFFLTHMLMATLMTWAGTGAARKDIHERKLDVLDASLLQRGIWRYTPVLIANTFLRGLAMGFYWTFLAGVPVFLLTWAAIGNGTMDGWPYILFKGMYSSFGLAPLVYTMVFLSAIDISNFPGLEAAEYAAAGGFAGEVGAEGDAGSEVEATVLMSPGGHIKVVPSSQVSIR